MKPPPRQNSRYRLLFLMPGIYRVPATEQGVINLGFAVVPRPHTLVARSGARRRLQSDHTAPCSAADPCPAFWPASSVDMPSLSKPVVRKSMTVSGSIADISATARSSISVTSRMRLTLPFNRSRTLMLCPRQPTQRVRSLGPKPPFFCAAAHLWKRANPTAAIRDGSMSHRNRSEKKNLRKIEIIGTPKGCATVQKNQRLTSANPPKPRH